MPGKKKGKKGKSGQPERPPLEGPTDSLRADIAAAGDVIDDDDNDDIAAQLLASLDAREEAAQEKPQKERSGDDGHSRHRSSSGVLSGLKEASDKLFHPSRSPNGGASETAIQSPPSDSPLASASASSSSPVKKMGRQKLRKQRKDAEAAADRARYEEELKANGGNVDEAELERQGITVACQSLGVKMHDITPDGHCLYSSIADQYNLLYHHHRTYQDMRKLASQHMKAHRDDFLPFVSDSDEKMAGIINSEAGKKNNDHALEDHYLAYCDAIETTAVWGGQPEILALSQALDVPIWVVQSGSPTLKIGEEKRTTPLLISYHRKMFGLGEHYQSLRPV